MRKKFTGVDGMQRMYVSFYAFFIFIIVASAQSAFAQNWTNADYQKALWMTTRFYGAQRSGDNNWTLANHLPSGVNAALTGRAFRADYNTTDNVDLSGGWHDCGDHVKFGVTQFYSAYLLLKGYAEFTAGYDDKYSFTYAGYKSSNQWNYEGTGHDPNCIPDVLDEMKHETDFLIKCTPDASNFWFQVGNGGCGGANQGDHCRWETAVKMQTNTVANGGNNDNGTPGARRPSCKNPNDGSMASFAGATLALMARLYAPYDAAYAALCQTHALNAYNYARTRLGNTVGSCFGGFYLSGARDSRDAFVCCCAELYYLTGNVAYRTEAFGHEAGVIVNAGWTFDYVNCGEIGLYCLAQMGNANAITKFNNRITGHYLAAGSRNAAGVYTAAGTWGRLRYNGNAAFLIGLYSKLNNNTTAAVINAIHNDVDYIMGKNTPKRSYIVGYAPAAGGPFVTPQYPHHRNVYLRDDNPGNATVLTIPAKNQQFGALVGGQRDGTYNDDRNDYVNSEVCIDYNAGLVGALGFINARLAPVTISCGPPPVVCHQPSLGADVSTCGSGFPVVLNSNTATATGVTFTWKRITPGASTLVTADANANTFSVTSVMGAGTYAVIRDSTGGCSKSDTIIISSALTTPDLGLDKEICNPAFYDLSPGNLASFPGGTTWQWAKDAAPLTGETNSTLSNVRTAGTYRLTASISGCASTFDEVVLTSSLPAPVDNCRTSTGTVSLSVTGGTGPFNWYAAATGGSILSGGSNTSSYTTPSISATTTYYVEAGGGSSTGSVGKANNTGGGWNGIPNGSGGAPNTDHLYKIQFNALQAFTLTSIVVYPETVQNITIRILASNNSTVLFTKTFNNVGTGAQTLALGFNIPLGNGYYMDAVGTTGNLWLNNGGATFPYNSTPAGIATLTGTEPAWVGGTNLWYPYFYNWQLTVGGGCARMPVIATINPGCSSLPVEMMNFYANNNSDNVFLSWATVQEINNDYFNVERSSDGYNYEAIGKVKGAGNSSSALVYSFRDEEPLYATSYYRIAQYDFDGTLNYSETISVQREDESSVSVVPNPFGEETNILVTSLARSKVKLKITDLSGRIVFSSEEYSTNERISAGADLPKGVYIIQAIFNNTVHTTRMIKQ